MDTIHRQERKRKREGERGERERGRGREGGRGEKE